MRLLSLPVFLGERGEIVLDTIYSLLGITASDYNFSDDVVLVLAGLFLLFCLGYVFDLFATLLERCTAKKGK